MKQSEKPKQKRITLWALQTRRDVAVQFCEAQLTRLRDHLAELDPYHARYITPEMLENMDRVLHERRRWMHRHSAGNLEALQDRPDLTVHFSEVELFNLRGYLHGFSDRQVVVAKIDRALRERAEWLQEQLWGSAPPAGWVLDLFNQIRFP